MHLNPDTRSPLIKYLTCWDVYTAIYIYIVFYGNDVIKLQCWDLDYRFEWPGFKAISTRLGSNPGAPVQQLRKQSLLGNPLCSWMIKLDRCMKGVLMLYFNWDEIFGVFEKQICSSFTTFAFTGVLYGLGHSRAKLGFSGRTCSCAKPPWSSGPCSSWSSSPSGFSTGKLFTDSTHSGSFGQLECFLGVNIAFIDSNLCFLSLFRPKLQS